MSEENKAIARRAIEEFVRGNLGAIDELYDPNYVDHSFPPEMPQGHEGLKQVSAMYFEAFPQMSGTIEDQIAEGDKVVTRWSNRLTHGGEFMGIAPTGKQVAITGISIHRIAGGKLAEHWVNWDQLGLMQQLGAIPPMGESGE